MASTTNIGRIFHWLGLLLAGLLGLAIIVGMAIDFVRLRLWDVQADELPMVTGALLLGVLGWGLLASPSTGLFGA